MPNKAHSDTPTALCTRLWYTLAWLLVAMSRRYRSSEYHDPELTSSSVSVGEI